MIGRASKYSHLKEPPKQVHSQGSLNNLNILVINKFQFNLI